MTLLCLVTFFWALFTWMGKEVSDTTCIKTVLPQVHENLQISAECIDLCVPVRIDTHTERGGGGCRLSTHTQNA